MPAYLVGHAQYVVYEIFQRAMGRRGLANLGGHAEELRVFNQPSLPGGGNGGIFFKLT